MRRAWRKAKPACASSPKKPGDRKWKPCSRVRRTPTTPIWRFTPGPAVPKARTGPACSRACTSAGRRIAATRCRWWRRVRARKRVSSRQRCSSKARMPTAGSRPNRACIGWCAFRLTTAMRVGTYRASGAGGQHVNTTDSAVRITHIPTNIVVASQQERSQIKNRAIAWAMLKSRLYELELKKREEKANAAAASKTEIGWGHQIRSDVMQPYQMVKDLRAGTQSSDPQGVLDGDLDTFLETALAQKMSGVGPAKVEDLD